MGIPTARSLVPVHTTNRYQWINGPGWWHEPGPMTPTNIIAHFFLPTSPPNHETAKDFCAESENDAGRLPTDAIPISGELSRCRYRRLALPPLPPLPLTLAIFSLQVCARRTRIVAPPPPIIAPPPPAAARHRCVTATALLGELLGRALSRPALAIFIVYFLVQK
jgi:hypothetical protein